MGVLKETIDALRSVILLQDQLNRLSSNVGKMAERLDDVQQRLIRVESREDAILARAESAARTAATGARQSEIGDIRERLVKIEIYLASQAAATAAVPKLLQSDGSSPESPA